MKNAEHILREWDKDISGYYKLNIDEAQKLYMKMERCNGQLKDIIRDRLITGTLYLIPKYIRKSILPYLKNNSFDMNDIISVCNEEWIKIIDSRKIMNVSMFNFLFDNNFYYDVSMNLVSKYNLYKFINVNNDFFISSLIWYVEKYNATGYVSYDCFYDYYLNYIDGVNNIYNVTPCKNPVNIYDLIVKIHLHLKSNGYDKNISSRQVTFLRNIIIDCVLFEKSSLTTIQSNDCFDEISNKELENQILDYIFNKFNIKENNKNVLRYYFGIDDGVLKTFKATGDKFDITRAGAEQSVKRTIKKIREKGSDIMPLIKEYLEK